jgi:putative pyruvate formate lyase activating enzyme
MPSMPQNVRTLGEMIRGCTLCPRRCGVDRTAGQLGACRTHAQAVAEACPHFGEEPALVGRGGSGTIFLAGCNLTCLFCQNFNISQLPDVRAYKEECTARQIAEMAMALQQRGCVNINFVTPTHVAHVVAEAIVLAREAGLTVPVVYNCGGYESPEVLRLMEGLVEIYMPDFKYADAAAGLKYSGVPDYPAVASAALAEMYRQVGPLQQDAGGVATRGVLVRHLVLPGDIARSREVIDRVATIAPASAINVMGQYRPMHQAWRFPELQAVVTAEGLKVLRDYAVSRGLRRVDGGPCSAQPCP